MAVRTLHYKDQPEKVARTAEDKLKVYGTTLEDGDRYFDRIHAAVDKLYGDQVRRKAKVATEPTDNFLYGDLTALPKEVITPDGTAYPLPLAIITEVINRSEHRVITRNCTCRTTFECRSYDTKIGCVHIGKATAEEPDTVANHVSKQEAIDHVKFAISLGLLPYIAKLDFDNEFWGIWSGEPMFTVCLCCPCCCLSRNTYAYMHPLDQARRFHPGHGLKWKYNASKCRGEDCQVCVRQCYFAHAITFENGHIKHDNDKCVMCGQCVSRCPGGALSIATDDLEDTIRGIMKRYDGQCGDLGFNGEDYAEAILRTTPLK